MSDHNMKAICITLVLGCVSSCIGRIDVHKLKLPMVAGEVVSATWKSSHKYELLVIEEGGIYQTTIANPDTWFLLLRNVRGCDPETSSTVSKLFMHSEPTDVLAFDYDPKVHSLFLRFTGSKNLEIRPGTEIELTDCDFSLSALGGSMGYSKLMTHPLKNSPQPANN